LPLAQKMVFHEILSYFALGIPVGTGPPIDVGFRKKNSSSRHRLGLTQEPYTNFYSDLLLRYFLWCCH
jgi:hypothetical protein